MIQVIWTQEKKDKAIEMLTKYFEEHGNGECIAQGDSAQFEAIELMCTIADDVLINNEGIIYTPED
jgi:hypothetical protein